MSNSFYQNLLSVFRLSKFLFVLVVVVFCCNSSLLAQQLGKLEARQLKDAPQMIEREKAVIYIRSTVVGLFVNSTNPDYTFRKVDGKDGEFVLRINPSQAYVISFGAPGYLSTMPKRQVLKLREVQVWEIVSIAPEVQVSSAVKIPEGIGKLVIQGRPEGATIELDYLEITQKLPATIEKIKSGEHTVQIKTTNIYSVPNPTQVIIQPNQTTEVEINDKLEWGVLSINLKEINELKINDFSFVSKRNFYAPQNVIPYRYKKTSDSLFIDMPTTDSAKVDLIDIQEITFSQKFKLTNEDTVQVFPNRLDKATLKFDLYGVKRVRINQYEPVSDGVFNKWVIPYKTQLLSGNTLLVDVPVATPVNVQVEERNIIYPIYRERYDLKKSDYVAVQPEYAKFTIDISGLESLKIKDYSIIEGKATSLNFPFKTITSGNNYTVYIPSDVDVSIVYKEPYLEEVKDTLRLKKGEEFTYSYNRGSIIVNTDSLDAVRINNFYLILNGQLNANFPYRTSRVETKSTFKISVALSDKPVKIKLDRAFHNSFEQTYELKKGEEYTVTYSLEPRRLTAQFDSKLDSVVIYATQKTQDEKPVDFTPIGFTNTPIDMQAGEYHFKFEKPEYVTKVERLTMDNPQQSGVVKFPVKLKFVHRFWNANRIIWTMLIGGGGYAAYNFLIKPEFSTSGGSGLPLPPVFPDGVGR